MWTNDYLKSLKHAYIANTLSLVIANITVKRIWFSKYNFKNELDEMLSFNILKIEINTLILF